MTDLPPTQGLLVDPHSEWFRKGKADAFTDWWDERGYSPKDGGSEYSQGYAFGWEMASDPLHEDGYDPQLTPSVQVRVRRR